MKTTIKYLMAALLLWGCHQAPTRSITVSVLADKTDSIIPKPNIAHIRQFMDIPVYNDGEREFWYGNITHTSINTEFRAELTASSLMENSLKRKMEVENFFGSIASHLEHENGIVKTYHNSSVIKPLVTNLHKIKQSSSSNKTVLLYSDILEASDLLNVYQTKGYLELLHDPDKVVERFRKHVNIGDLSGVDLYIVYYPKDMKDNRLFEQMLTVYRKLFENSGLTIQIGITNPLTQQP